MVENEKLDDKIIAIPSPPETKRTILHQSEALLFRKFLGNLR